MKSIRFLTRVLALPFLAVVILIHVLTKWMQFCIHFLIHGGEIISYDKNLNQKKITDLYDLILSHYERRDTETGK